MSLSPAMLLVRRTQISRALGSVPKDKAKVTNGALTIHYVAKNDGGIYMCKAENILGPLILSMNIHI